MKPKINSVEVHPQLSNNGHPVDGVLVGVLVHRARALPVLFAVGLFMAGMGGGLPVLVLKVPKYEE